MDRVKYSNRRIIVSGFPRSGNTFLRTIIKYSYINNSVPLHMHVISYIKNDEENSIFCVPIRNPKEAISSEISEKHFNFLNYSKIDQEKIIQSLFKFYNRFYNEIIQIDKNIIFFNFNKIIESVDYVYEKIFSFCELNPEIYLSNEDAKNFTIKDFGNSNLPKNNLNLLKEIYNIVEFTQGYEDIEQLYLSVIINENL